MRFLSVSSHHSFIQHILIHHRANVNIFMLVSILSIKPLVKNDLPDYLIFEDGYILQCCVFDVMLRSRISITDLTQ